MENHKPMTQTALTQLLFFRITTITNPDGYLFVADHYVTATKLFMAAYPDEKTFTVLGSTEQINQLTNLN